MKTADRQQGASVTSNSDKSGLEVQKLQLEITHLRSRWYMPALIQATPATLVVLATIFIAWSTGLLDARRENLSAQNERLQTQKMLLQEEEKQILEQMGSLTAKLHVSQTELNAFKAEEQAIRKIRDVWPLSTVEYLLDDYGFKIKLNGWHIKSITTEGPDGRITTNLEEDDPTKTLNVIRSIATMRNVRALSIEDISLSQQELEALGQIPSLNTLDFVRNDLSDDAMKGFPQFRELKCLNFYCQPFKFADTLNRCSGLEVLRFYSTPIDGRSLRELRNLKNLECIGLHSTAVTDEDMQALFEFPRLWSLSVEATKVTQNGIRQLASHEPLRNLFISDQLNTEELVEEVRQTNRVLLLVPSSLAINYGGHFVLRDE